MVQSKLEESDSKKYKFKLICKSEVYSKESDSHHLLNLYYLVFQKGYLEEENT